MGSKYMVLGGPLCGKQLERGTGHVSHDNGDTAPHFYTLVRLTKPDGREVEFFHYIGQGLGSMRKWRPTLSPADRLFWNRNKT